MKKDWRAFEKKLGASKKQNLAHKKGLITNDRHYAVCSYLKHLQKLIVNQCHVVQLAKILKPLHVYIIIASNDSLVDEQVERYYFKLWREAFNFFGIYYLKMQSCWPLVSRRNSGRGDISHCAQSRSLQLHLHLLHSRNNAYGIFLTLPNVGDLLALMRDMRRTNVSNDLSGLLKRG